MSDSLWPAKLFSLRDSPGKNAGVGCHALLQGIFPIQGWNPCLLQLLHCKWILYHWATREAPSQQLSYLESFTMLDIFYLVKFLKSSFLKSLSPYWSYPYWVILVFHEIDHLIWKFWQTVPSPSDLLSLSWVDLLQERDWICKKNNSNNPNWTCSICNDIYDN